MTEREVGILIGAIDRWIRNAINARLDSNDEGKWEELEINECKENIAATLLGTTVDALPESLQFTLPG